MLILTKTTSIEKKNNTKKKINTIITLRKILIVILKTKFEYSIGTPTYVTNFKLS